MRVYLDSSAFVKTFIAEVESSSLVQFLDGLQGATVISSILLETEVRRAATERGVEQADVTQSLASVELVEASRARFTLAGLLPVPGLRSLDAIHLATAIDTASDLLVGYDRRLLAAAAFVGLPTATPA